LESRLASVSAKLGVSDGVSAELELRRREQQRPSTIGPEQLKAIQRLGCDIGRVWAAVGRDDDHRP